MIRNLQYDVCIRPERGYCRFQLQESSSVIASFVLDPAPAIAAATVKRYRICSQDKITNLVSLVAHQCGRIEF